MKPTNQGCETSPFGSGVTSELRSWTRHHSPAETSFVDETFSVNSPPFATDFGVPLTIRQGAGGGVAPPLALEPVQVDTLDVTVHAGIFFVD